MSHFSPFDGKVVIAPVLNGVISERALIRDIPTFDEVERIVNAIDRK
jgi:hypothetical protein